MKYKTVDEIIKDLELNPVEKGGHIYHPIPFPEFEKLKTSSNKNEVYKKSKIIKSYLMKLSSNELKKLKILDIGSNAGFYTFTLAKEGAKVTAFEPHPRYAPIGKFLAKEKNLNVKWYSVPFNFNYIKEQHFDVAFLLSVFQWMAGGGQKLEESYKELKRISTICDYMIFELGFNKGKSCIKILKLNHYAALIKILQKHTNYRNFKLLGKTKLWRGSCRYLVMCSNDPDFSDFIFYKLVRMVKI